MSRVNAMVTIFGDVANFTFVQIGNFTFVQIGNFLENRCHDELFIPKWW
jgi:hypothetical protein